MESEARKIFPNIEKTRTDKNEKQVSGGEFESTPRSN